MNVSMKMVISSMIGVLLALVVDANFGITSRLSQ